MFGEPVADTFFARLRIFALAAAQIGLNLIFGFGCGGEFKPRRFYTRLIAGDYFHLVAAL